MHCRSLRFPPQERNISHVLGVGNKKSGNRRKSRSVQIRWTLDRLAVATVALLGATNNIWGGGETVAGKRGTFISICRAAGATGRRRGNRRKNAFFRLLHTRPPPLCPGKTGIHSKRGGMGEYGTNAGTHSIHGVCLSPGAMLRGSTGQERQCLIFSSAVRGRSLVPFFFFPEGGKGEGAGGKEGDRKWRGKRRKGGRGGLRRRWWMAVAVPVAPFRSPVR